MELMMMHHCRNGKQKNHVEVPRSTILLTENELSVLLNEVNPLFDDNEHGISLYESAKRVLIMIISNR